MRVLVTGSTGLVGSALVSFLTTGGHSVVRLVRPESKAPAGQDCWSWDPVRGTMLSSTQGGAGREGPDAVVHLAGQNIAAARWTAKQKAKIRESRVVGTRNLCELLTRFSPPPRVLVCASAIGYYGDRGDELLREESPSGSGFVAEVCREWEAASEPAAQKGIRVVILRTGLVLSPAGGALGKMLLPFKMGLGGKIGSGKQYMSWIAMDDHRGVILHALSTDTLRGPVNAVAPNPVTNLEFTKTLGRVLGRPTLFPMPAFAVRLAFGEMGEELLLGSTRVEPARLLATGYKFRFPELEGALRNLLGKGST